MNKSTLKISDVSHNPFIDFLKGVCIILVVVTHCIPWESRILFQLWGRTAIPIFFIIQVFHVYKYGFDFRLPNLKKIWHRILRPFFCIQLLIAVLLLAFHPNVSFRQYIEHILRMGGYGPGEYYPWVYIQFAFIIPIIAPIFKKVKPSLLLCIFIAISQFFEILSCLSNIPDWPYYSLCFVRYTFLIYLGYVLVTQGFVVNKKTIAFSIISLGVTYYLTYSNQNYEPFFFSRTQWKYCHWICYIYIAFIVIPFLKVIYDWIQKIGYVNHIVKQLGICSYEIYLFQMLYFATLSPCIRWMIGHLPARYGNVSYVIISVGVCLLIPLLYKHIGIYKERIPKA